MLLFYFILFYFILLLYITRNVTEPRCPIGEVYEKCPDNLCKPETCSQLGLPIPCPLDVSGSKCLGKPRCICANGNVRDANGKCIPKDQCREYSQNYLLLPT